MAARTLNRLTAKRVTANLAPGYHADGGGLYLRVKPTGTRSWVLVSNKGGRRVEKGIGSASSVSLAEARRLRDNPPRMEEAKPLTPLFGDWADAFIAGLRGGWKNEKHRAQWTSTLETLAKPIRAMHVDAITTDDVLAVLRPIWTKTPTTASRLRGRIERILDAAKARGHIRSPWENPARWRGHLEHFLPRKRKSEKGHHAAVPWEAMPAFWATLSARRSSTTVQALRFTILTAARTGEALGARVCEFDLAAKKWTVPASRMKTEIEHQVALSDAAVAIVNEMSLGRQPDERIFPLSNTAMLMLMKDELSRKETVHGFRSSFRDWAGEATDYPRELAEMALAHAVGDAVEQAYRRGRALEKRRPLMDDWASYLVGA